MSSGSKEVENVRATIASACDGLVNREALVELVVLCAIAKEHLLVIGPPGTAKSEAVRGIARGLGGRYFEYLIGRFTEPSEIFGPINLKKLKEGIVETETAGMLPDAEIAFLDEVFLGSTAILNTLLGILNERTFRRGHSTVQCPLRVCVGATNRLPEDEQLAAFADRFLARVFVDAVPDFGLEELLASGSARLTQKHSSKLASVADLDVLSALALAVDLTDVRPSIAHAVRRLRAAGIEWTDRRVVRVQKLVAAAAVLSGRTKATDADLWPIIYALPTADAQTAGRDALRDLLTVSENGSLLASAAEASLGPAARAAKTLKEGTAILDLRPSADNQDAWRLRVEGLAREIDATFARAVLSPELAALRARAADALKTQPA